MPADRREAVETWLANHPEDAARVASWRAQAEAIRSHFGAVIDEAVPARLQIDRITRNRRSWAAIAAAAAIVAFVGGGIAGWMARGASASAPSELETFASEALGAHRLYIGEVRHPIEVKAEENHLLPWLSRRVGTTLRAPDLAAFDLKLLGGRLLPGVNAPAALFMYESGSGERVTIYVSRTTEAAYLVPLQGQRQVRRAALERRRLRLGRQRPRRQAAAQEHRHRLVRAARQPHPGSRTGVGARSRRCAADRPDLGGSADIAARIVGLRRATCCISSSSSASERSGSTIRTVA